MNTTPHGRGARLRKPAVAALSTVALASPAAAAIAQTTTDTPPAAIKLRVTHHVLKGHRVAVHGLHAGAAGQGISVQRANGSGWKTVKRVKTAASGRFRASFRTGKLGRMKVRAIADDGAKSHVRKATVYRSVFASYYGPGLYGNRLACGGRLTPSTIGVANKTMPCGTRIRLHHAGRTVTARVIDRGPYVGGRTYDLTEATKRRLHFGSTGHVWSSK